VDTEDCLAAALIQDKGVDAGYLNEAACSFMGLDDLFYRMWVCHDGPF
jgi:hypothetical protein